MIDRKGRALLLAAWGAAMLTAAHAEESCALRVEAGRTVQFEYALLLPDGEVIETSAGAPFRYVHGESAMLPPLAAALDGMTVDEEKWVTLTPSQAYGERDSRALRVVPIEAMPYDARAVGASYAVAGYDWPVTVSEVRGDSVVLDLNHPLAGRSLTFRIRVLSITPNVREPQVAAAP